MQKYKVVIIGSGIAGMTSAIYLKRGGINPLIIENSAPGGKLGEIPVIENYPGYVSISGPDLACEIYTQVKELKIDYLFKNISSVDLKKKVIDNEIAFDYLIIATGRKLRYLGLENEDKLLGKGVSTCALCDGNFYKDREVIVVGGGASALTESLYLSKICKKVNLIYRGSEFKAEKYLIDKVEENDKINIIYGRSVVSYDIKDDALVGVTLDNGTKVEASGVFLAIGSDPNSELFDVNKDNGYIEVEKNGMTNIENIYAIGDVIKKDFYQLTTAASEGVVAASDIIRKER